MRVCISGGGNDHGNDLYWPLGCPTTAARRHQRRIHHAGPSASRAPAARAGAQKLKENKGFPGNDRSKIYKPTKTAMQSGNRNSKNWLLEFDTLQTGINPLTGWQTSRDTMSEVKLEFLTKDQAINYAKKNNLDFYIIEPKKRKIIKKSYTDNFIK